MPSKCGMKFDLDNMICEIGKKKNNMPKRSWILFFYMSILGY